MSRVLVTGGSGGIGAALVRRLRAEGHEIVFTFCRGAERARQLEEATGARPLHYDQSSIAVPLQSSLLITRKWSDASERMTLLDSVLAFLSWNM